MKYAVLPGNRAYNWVDPELKSALIHRVRSGEKIKKVADQLGIHYSNAKMIVRRM